MNNRNKNTEKENIKLTLSFWILLFTGCMVVMLEFAANKTIVIADGYQEQTGLPVGVSPEEHGPQDTELVLKSVYGVSDKFSVPLPKNVKAENVAVENRYMDRELWVYIQSEDIDFYKENELFGDISPIQSGCSEVWKDGILLKLRMKQVLEYKSTMEENVLTFACYEPGELYDFIVVLDPEGGGSDAGYCGVNLSEKDLTLQVARLVQKKLTNSQVRLYLTRTEDVTVEERERIRLSEEVDADFYICLGAESDEENPETYGIRGEYNEEYFFPGFGNVELADVVTREVTIASGNRAIGLFAAEEDSILCGLATRGARVSLGYLSNPKEETLQQQEVYQEKLAEGIVKAITEACKILHSLDTE